MSEQIEIDINNNDLEAPILEDENQDCFNFNHLRLDGSSSNKRRSPESATAVTSSKRPKKVLFQDHDSEETKNPSCANCYNGFRKISLPSPRLEQVPKMKTLTQSPNSVASLRRCVSDIGDSNACSCVNLDPQSPPESGKNVSGNVAATPCSKETLPPRPVAYRRTVSEPSPRTNFSKSSSCHEMGVDVSPTVENLKKLKSCMKEMNQWLEEVVPDEDEDGNEHVKKKEEEEEEEEAVSVERVGNCLMIHFKCPCGKGYQILFRDGNCYYKLT